MVIHNDETRNTGNGLDYRLAIRFDGERDLTAEGQIEHVVRGVLSGFSLATIDMIIEPHIISLIARFLPDQRQPLAQVALSRVSRALTASLGASSIEFSRIGKDDRRMIDKSPRIHL